MTPPPDEPAAVIADLLAQEAALLDPSTRHSPSAVSALLAEDFVEYGASGRVFDKAAIVAGLAAEAGPPVPARRTMTDATVRLLAPGVALVTYRATRDHADGTRTTSLRSSIWRREDGVWRMAFHQGTPTRQP